QDAEGAEDHPGDPEEVERTGAVAGDKQDREEVHEPVEHPLHAVLALAVLARTMIDDELFDAKAAVVGEDGEEAVEAAVDGELAHAVDAVGLEAAVEVVQADAGQAADDGVEDPRGQGLVDGVVADFLPPGDE